MTKKNINGIRKFRHMKINKVNKQLVEIIELLGNPTDFQRTRFNIHKVPVDGTTYLVADAIVLNKFDNQRGRGCWRYLFDTHSREYAGIAQEVDGGSYKMVV